MIHIIYMAAGQSRRYGENKLLCPYNGQPLYRHGLSAIRAAIRGRADCTLTVVSCWTEITEAMQREKIACVDCAQSHLGVSYTVRAGIAACGALREDDYLCFCVADQPGLTPATVMRLLDSTAEKPLTACLCADGVQGNPVLFHASLASELVALQGDRGGKAVMRAHPERHVDVACSPVELYDVDTPQ